MVDEPSATPETPAPTAADTDRLAEAERAFAAGDYAAVRSLTSTLLDAKSGDVAKAARELRARVSVDPLQLAVVLACVAFLAAVALVWVVR
jgi:hypothetical protein